MSGEAESWTFDRPAPGVVICQPRSGFRYGSESFWLVGFALQAGVPARALDMGTGSGIMAMLLAARGIQTVGVDLHPAWRGLWSHTRDLSLKPASLRIHDVALPLDVRADLVVCNPPFYRAGSGSLPADPWLSTARFESTAALEDSAATLTAMPGAAARPRSRTSSLAPTAPWTPPIETRLPPTTHTTAPAAAAAEGMVIPGTI